MSEGSEIRFVRVAFVVVKLRAGTESFYLLRYNPRWHDLNLIGGHEDAKDNGGVERTARRELREEVPLVRFFDEYRLTRLLPPRRIGPTFSKSKNAESLYEAHYFLLNIEGSPAPLVHLLTTRSKNVWVEQERIRARDHINVSNYVRILETSIEGGLKAIPFSSTTNLISVRNHFDGASSPQMRFRF